MTSLRRILAVMGNPDCGRLGLGAVKTSVEFPTVVKSLLGLRLQSVAAGGAHTAVIADDGTVYTFGLNDYGQLGHSPDHTEVHQPIEVPLPEPAIAIAAGNFHTLCVTESGLVWAWGSNAIGQCGLGNELANTSEPRVVAALKNEKVTAVAAGAEHSLALSRTGEVYSWGGGGQGKLGHGSPPTLQRFLGRQNKPEWKPRLIRALETHRIVQISAGHMHSGCVTSDSRAFMFGSGRFHQLGRSSTDADAATPIELQGPPHVYQVACGGTHSLVIAPGGVVASWGADQGGCLGRVKVEGGAGDIKRPEPVPGVVADQVAAGWKHSAAIGDGGTLMTWGWGGSQGTFAVHTHFSFFFRLSHTPCWFCFATCAISQELHFLWNRMGVEVDN